MLLHRARITRCKLPLCSTIFPSRSFSNVRNELGRCWATNPEDKVDIRLGNEGCAARPPQTFIDVFRERVNQNGSNDALKCKRKVNNRVTDEWKTWTWQDYWNDSTSFAKSLIKLDIKMHGVINIIGFNSPEWLIANNGAILSGVIPSGVYTTSSPQACQQIAAHSKAELLVVEDNIQLTKYENSIDDSRVKAIVMYSEEPLSTRCGNIPIYTFDEFMALGVDIPQSEIDARQSRIAPGNCCLLIYTSGTSGKPKGVMISHDNVTWTTRTLVDSWLKYAGCDDRVVSYLPLSHISAQLLDLHMPLCTGVCAYVAQPDALKGSLLSTLLEVKPTIFFGVPRVWEKIEEKMKDAGRGNKGLKKLIGDWAKSVGRVHSEQQQFGKSGCSSWSYALAKRLVFSNVKKALGFEYIKGFYSGAAPISTDTLDYFSSLDIPVYEGYGMSESSGGYSMCYDKAWVPGTVGQPMSGTETRIDSVTGELQIRGRNVFMGYLYQPELTQSTINDDGFMSTGDVAIIDDSGFMKITGRTKELIITAGAENIAPLAIETNMKNEMPALSNCVVVGDKRKYLTMLVSLKCEVDTLTNTPTDCLAPTALHIGNEIGSTARTMSEAACDPKWVEYINKGMLAANSRAVSNPQKIQKWRMLPADLSEAQGDLTPTQKIKRNVVLSKYSNLCDEMYAEAK